MSHMMTVLTDMAGILRSVRGRAGGLLATTE